MRLLRSLVLIGCSLAIAAPSFALHNHAQHFHVVRHRRPVRRVRVVRRRIEYRHRIVYRHHARLRRIYWNPVFRGSRDSLLLQNAEIDRLDLPRIADEEQLDDLVRQGELVPLEDSEYVSVEITQPSHRYCKPWTRDFVEDLGKAHYEEFHRPIVITSAVRTMEQQARLRRHNRNAAPVEGETASSHLAGITVDILKRGMTRKERHWLDDYMEPLKTEGVIEPEEERRQPVYHVMVSSHYSEPFEIEKAAVPLPSLNADTAADPQAVAGK